MDYTYLNSLNSAMDAYALRDKAISGNLANANTPGYKRKYVKFEEFLANANTKYHLRGAITNSKHIPIPTGFSKKPFIATDNSVSTREDGNNVNVDTEELDKSKNGLQYSMIADAVTSYFKSINSAITGGRK